MARDLLIGASWQSENNVKWISPINIWITFSGHSADTPWGFVHHPSCIIITFTENPKGDLNDAKDCLGSSAPRLTIWPLCMLD